MMTPLSRGAVAVAMQGTNTWMQGLREAALVPRSGRNPAWLNGTDAGRDAVRSVRAHLGPQAGDGLAVQLADAGFRDPKHSSDFLEIHVMLVVHAHDVLLAFGQALDGIDQ